MCDTLASLDARHFGHVKLGIIADIHGNDRALRAVLNDAEGLEVDRWWVPTPNPAVLNIKAARCARAGPASASKGPAWRSPTRGRSPSQMSHGSLVTSIARTTGRPSATSGSLRT
jgi:hypothetical protein